MLPDRSEADFQAGMIPDDELLLAGEMIHLENQWEIEFEEEECAEIPALRRLLESLGADISLMIDYGGSELALINFAKAEDGRWFAAWTETHPERGSYSEFFGRQGEHLLNAEKAREWEDLCARMPSSDYAGEIAPRDAFEIMASLWLPRDFWNFWEEA